MFICGLLGLFFNVGNCFYDMNVGFISIVNCLMWELGLLTDKHFLVEIAYFELVSIGEFYITNLLLG